MAPDIVCPLFDVPDSRPLLTRLESEGIIIRHARTWERTAVCDFVREQFSQRWAEETVVGFGYQPITVIVATENQRIIGFAAYEVTARAYFGPTGVEPSYRGRGIGKALLLEALAGLRALGYVYGFIGAPGPIDFYLKATPGLVLPADWRNIYSGTPGT